MKILNLIPSGDHCGWGVCGKNLAKHFTHYKMAVNEYDADVILVPVVNEGWSYPPHLAKTIELAKKAGKKIVGYGFHEYELIGTMQIELLAKNFDGLACGSYWMRDWVLLALANKGLQNKVWLNITHQGVDLDQFYYYHKFERPDFLKGKFVVCSAGKLEYRKGQDLVIEAFRRFSKSCPEAFLIAAWDNPWTDTIQSMKESSLIDVNKDIKFHMTDKYRFPLIAGIDERLIPKEQQAMFQMGLNSDMPSFYASADVGLFPSRCEAAQSNCLCENISCGVPAITVDYAGISDLKENSDRLPIHFVKPNKIIGYNNWVEPCIDELVDALHRVRLSNYSNDDKFRLSQHKFLRGWDNTAKSLVDLCETVYKN